MEVSGQLHDQAALPSGKEPLVPTGEEAGWVPEPVCTRLKREKFPAPVGNRIPRDLKTGTVCTICVPSCLKSIFVRRWFYWVKMCQHLADTCFHLWATCVKVQGCPSAQKISHSKTIRNQYEFFLTPFASFAPEEGQYCWLYQVPTLVRIPRQIVDPIYRHNHHRHCHYQLIIGNKTKSRPPVFQT
jgi:hypothetical protein